jgi:dUTP pyrophosphatase
VLFRSALGTSQESRQISSTKDYQAIDGVYQLPAGAYRITYNEVVEVPAELVAISFPRSSLLRCGVLVGNAVWDPGYEGRGTGLLLVSNTEGFRIEINARLVQIIFMTMTEAPNTLYSGIFKEENI